MKNDEFMIWWSDYCEKFPSVLKYIERLGTKAGKALLRTWADALKGTPIRHALIVNKAMSVGDLEPVGNYDNERERTAVIIKRAVARRLESERAHAKPAVEMLPTKMPSRSPSFDIRGALDKVEQLVNSGRTREEAVREALPTAELDEPGPRYLCGLCCDGGLVSVWHFESMRAWRTDPELLNEARYRLSMMTPCECEQGRAKVLEPGQLRPTGWTGWTRQEAIYSPRRHFLCENLHSETHLAQFCVWCSAYFEVEAEDQKNEAAIV